MSRSRERRVAVSVATGDNGIGLSPEVLTHLVKHIGGSAKRSDKGRKLEVTSSTNSKLSPGGRQLIGKLGIGLFSVAQFTRHFLIITKTSGDRFRTIADITLGKKSPQKKGRIFETGQYRIWRERATDKKTQGTEIKLLDLLPRTRDELASDDLWTRHEYQVNDPDAEKAELPELHIGRMASRSEAVCAAVPMERAHEAQCNRQLACRPSETFSDSDTTA